MSVSAESPCVDRALTCSNPRHCACLQFQPQKVELRSSEQAAYQASLQQRALGLIERSCLKKKKSGRALGFHIRIHVCIYTCTQTCTYTHTRKATRRERNW